MCLFNLFVYYPFMIVYFFISICGFITYNIGVCFIRTFYSSFCTFHTWHMPCCNRYFISHFKFTLISRFHIFWNFTFIIMLHMALTFLVISVFIFFIIIGAS